MDVASPLDFHKSFVNMFVDALFTKCDQRPKSLPAKRSDPVLEAIIRFLLDLDAEPTEYNAGRFHVEQFLSSLFPSIKAGTSDAPKLYRFLDINAYPGLVVPVRIKTADVYRKIGASAKHRDVRLNGRSNSLTDWIHNLPCPIKVTITGEEGYIAQRAWWAANGKTFRLMDLPPELRYDIYVFVLGPDVYPSTRRYNLPRQSMTCQNVMTLGRGYNPSPTSIAQRYPIVPRPNLNILLVSKQVSQEATKIGWEGTRKCFNFWGTFYVVTRALPFNPYNCMTRVHLSMSTYDYFQFFGLQLHASHGVMDAFTFEPGLDAYPDSFKRCPNLRSLELHFKDPFDGHRCDPFRYHTHLISPTSFQWFARQWSCHKVTADWILTRAKPYIQHIGEVKITGFIKHSVKAKWDRIFEDERKGIHHDTSDAEKKIFATPVASLAPPCFCSRSCEVTYHVRMPESYQRYDKQTMEFDFDD